MARLRQAEGWAVCLALSLLAFYPALTQGGLPQGSDISIHYWRAFELGQSWAQGDFLPRWAVHFYHGYGAPFFLYYASLPYALAVILGALPAIDDVTRLKLLWFLGLYLATCGTYSLAQRRWGRVGAVLSAAAFTFAPPIIFGEPIARGGLPVILALGLWASSFALLDRLAQGRPFLGAAVLSVAALLWAHNLTAVLGGALLVLWLAWAWGFNRGAYPHLGRSALALLLGIGGAAFFWLPLGMERDLVPLERLYAVENLDYRVHFQPTEAIFSLTPRYDAHRIGQVAPYQIGLALWSLALLGAFSLAHRLRTWQGREALLWAGAAGGLLFLVTPLSFPLWEALPLMAYFQFPARLLNAATLPLALLVGALGPVLEGFPPHRAKIVCAGALAVIFANGLAATPWAWTDSYPRQASPAAYLAYEMETNQLGTTGTNEFLPRTAKIPPPPSGFLLDSLAAGDPPLRVNTSVLPAEAELDIVTARPSHYEFWLETPQAIPLEIYQLYFEGWQVRLDGERIQPLITEPYGFYALEIPAGRHNIRLTYPLSAAQRGGLLVSSLSLLGAALLSWRDSRQKSPRQEAAFSGAYLAAMGVALTLGLIFAILYLRAGVGWRASAGGETTADYPFLKAVTPQTTLHGYDLQKICAGQWQVATYWTFNAPLSAPLTLELSLVDAGGNVLATRTLPDFGRVTTYDYWREDYHLREVLVFSGVVGEVAGISVSAR